MSKLCLFQLVDKTVVLGISKFSHIPVYFNLSFILLTKTIVLVFILIVFSDIAIHNPVLHLHLCI